MIRWFIQLVLPFWRAMALSVLLGVLTISSSIGLMATSAWMISKAGLQPSIAELGVSVVAVRFFGISRGVFRYLERLVSHEATFRILAALRVDFYRRLESLAPARLMQYRSGDLLNRIVKDIDTLQNVYLRVIAPPVVALITALLMCVFLFAFEPLLSLIVLGFMALSGLFIPVLAWWTAHQPGYVLTNVRADLNAHLVDQIQGLADSLVYGHHERQLQQLNTLSNTVANHETRLAWLEGVQTFCAVLLTNLAALLVLAAAIPRIDSIYLATVTLATLAAFETITPLSLAAHQLGATLAAGQRLLDIVDVQPEVTDPVNPLPKPANYDLNIRHLTFRYQPGEPLVINDLNLSIPCGQHVAILGKSGAGKSTLVNLLLRFWDCESGSIQLGGHELRDYAQDDIRQVLSVMSQRAHLFNTTLRENIRIGRSDANDLEVEAAAQQAQIHDFILSLPDGYDTLLNEDGASLSGGERQRVALARVLLRNSPIVILDEATAHLDKPAEDALLQTIQHVTHGRTLILLMHERKESLNLDQVITMPLAPTNATV